jgi:hypothetical protein
MSGKLLVCFNRSTIDNTVDFGEKIGNFGLGLLRIGFGKTVTVVGAELAHGTPVFNQTVHSTSARIAAIALFILLFPLTLLFAGIGCIATAFSKSYENVFKSYHSGLNSKQVVSIGPGDVYGLEWEAQLPKECDEVQTRNYPPVVMRYAMQLPDGSIVSKFSKISLFKDDQIKERLPIVKKKEIRKELKQGYHESLGVLLPNPYFVFYTKNNKAIIQQRSAKGCTAAATAMLIEDNGIGHNSGELIKRALAKDERMRLDISEAGLEPILTKLEERSLVSLRELIIENGSCIVTVGGVIGSHVIVVDEVSPDLSNVRLRDPYHGWEITVTSQAFLEEWHNHDMVIQVKQPKPSATQ